VESGHRAVDRLHPDRRQCQEPIDDGRAEAAL